MKGLAVALSWVELAGGLAGAEWRRTFASSAVGGNLNDDMVLFSSSPLSSSA